MTLTLRYMRLADLRAVAAIDRLCFQPAWSRDSYIFEIKESRVSHMVSLERGAGQAPAAAEAPRWRQLRGWLRSEAPAANGRRQVIGYGGLWKIAGEAHISAIATHPEWRGRGYGEILLAGMFGKALWLQAEVIVLEVCVSNTVAQSLYHKYGFSRFGRKRNYYRSNNEDAWDMRVALDSEARRRFARLHQALREKHSFRDAYSRQAHPRAR